MEASSAQLVWKGSTLMSPFFVDFGARIKRCNRYRNRIAVQADEFILFDVTAYRPGIKNGFVAGKIFYQDGSVIYSMEDIFDVPELELISTSELVGATTTHLILKAEETFSFHDLSKRRSVGLDELVGRQRKYKSVAIVGCIAAFYGGDVSVAIVDTKTIGSQKVECNVFELREGITFLGKYIDGESEYTLVNNMLFKGCEFAAEFDSRSCSEWSGGRVCRDFIVSDRTKKSEKAVREALRMKRRITEFEKRLISCEFPSEYVQAHINEIRKVLPTEYVDGMRRLLGEERAPPTAKKIGVGSFSDFLLLLADSESARGGGSGESECEPRFHTIPPPRRSYPSFHFHETEDPLMMEVEALLFNEERAFSLDENDIENAKERSYKVKMKCYTPLFRHGAPHRASGERWGLSRAICEYLRIRTRVNTGMDNRVCPVLTQSISPITRLYNLRDEEELAGAMFAQFVLFGQQDWTVFANSTFLTNVSLMVSGGRYALLKYVESAEHCRAAVIGLGISFEGTMDGIVFNVLKAQCGKFGYQPNNGYSVEVGERAFECVTGRAGTAAGAAHAIYNTSSFDGKKQPLRNSGVYCDEIFRLVAALSLHMVGIKRFIRFDDRIVELVYNGLTFFKSQNAAVAIRMRRTRRDRPEENFYSAFFTLGVMGEASFRESYRKAAASRVELYRAAGECFYAGVHYYYARMGWDGRSPFVRRKLDRPNRDIMAMKQTLVDDALVVEATIEEEPHRRVLLNYMIVALSLMLSGTADLDVLRIIRRQLMEVTATVHTDFIEGEYVKQYVKRYGDYLLYKTCAGMLCSDVRASPVEIVAAFHVNWPLSHTDQQDFIFVRNLIARAVFHDDSCSDDNSSRVEDPFDLLSRNHKYMFFLQHRDEMCEFDKKFYCDILADWLESHVKTQRKADHLSGTNFDPDVAPTPGFP